MNARKVFAIAALGLVLGGTLAENADARAGFSSRSGGYSSFGSRGCRTFESNRMSPITQSRTRQGTPQGGFSQPAYGANRPSFFQRSPFLAGLTGALAGSALFSMMGGLFGGHGGMGGYGGGGGGGGFMTLLILGGLGYFAWRMFRRRQVPGLASGPGGLWPSRDDERDLGGPSMFGTSGSVATGYRQTTDQGLAAIALNSPGFSTETTQDELSSAFFRIQEAWSAGDRQALRQLCTEEVYDEFASQLDELSARQERNIIKNTVMRQMDISEAWTEGDEEFLTVSIHARVIDYIERNGQVVQGSTTEPTDFREVWTFSRLRSTRPWQLSAINQAA